MKRIFILALSMLISVASEPAHAAQTPLVTGNGFGFAVYSFEEGKATRFYAHPYKFQKPDPKDPLSEGIETTNLIKGLSWGKPNAVRAADYVDDSQIIAATDDESTQFFYMPFGLDENVLVTSCNAKSKLPQIHVEWQHKVRKQTSIKVLNRNAKMISFTGASESILMVPLKAVTATKDTQGSECSSWAFVRVENEKKVSTIVGDIVRWQKGLSPQNLIDRELTQIESWRTRSLPQFDSPDERKLWRRSEMVLRMAQSREPNNVHRHNHGLIIASLPDGAWFVPWLRDMSYATAALIRMGHNTEARWAIESYFNCRPVGKMKHEVNNFPYQITSVRYFGDGSEEPFFTGEGATNVEFDNWGLALWNLAEYMEKFHDKSLLSQQTYRGTVYESAVNYIVKPLLGNLERYQDGLIVDADTSIWEERQKDKKHFAYSTAAAIAGLLGFTEVAKSEGDTTLVDSLRTKVPMLQKGYDRAFIKDGRLRGTLEEGIKNDIDGALLCTINFGVVKDAGVMERTVAEMERLKMPSGGYRRVHSIIQDPAIFEYWYERQEFNFVNFHLAEVLLRLNRDREANEIVARMIERFAKDHFFIPEMFVSEVNYRFKGAIGEQTGAIPMVGYGAGAFIMYVLERDALRKAGKIN